MVAIAEGQLLEHVKGEVDVLRTAVPLADAAQAAAVVAVLAVRHRVQVEEHRDSVTLSPGEGAVKVIDAAEVGLVIAEHEVGDRDPHGVDAAAGQVGEVPFGDERVAVRAKTFPLPVIAELGPQMGFALGRGAGEQRRGNPPLEHQPATEVDPADHGRSP